MKQEWLQEMIEGDIYFSWEDDDHNLYWIWSIGESRRIAYYDDQKSAKWDERDILITRMIDDHDWI